MLTRTILNKIVQGFIVYFKQLPLPLPNAIEKSWNYYRRPPVVVTRAFPESGHGFDAIIRPTTPIRPSSGTPKVM